MRRGSLGSAAAIAGRRRGSLTWEAQRAADPRSPGEEQAHDDRSRPTHDEQHSAVADPEDNAHDSGAAAEESEEYRHDPVSDCEGLSTKHSGAKEKGVLSGACRSSRVSAGHARAQTLPFRSPPTGLRAACRSKARDSRVGRLQRLVRRHTVHGISLREARQSSNTRQTHREGC